MYFIICSGIIFIRRPKLIKIFITGGTFDKSYNEIEGKLFFKNTHIKELLNLGRSQIEVDIETLMMVDSLDMTEIQRDHILDRCHSVKSDKIIITHGTDTMTKTASIIAKEKLNKTIVITGAMIPYKFGSSDGLFNIGGSLAYVQTLPHNVYIVMNGQCFKHGEVFKNKKTGFFQNH